MVTPSPVARLAQGLRKRRNLASDPKRRRILDARLLETLGATAAGLRVDEVGPLREPPPRRIAVAMALALLSQPLWAGLLAGAPQTVIHIDDDALSQALGLPAWELDDLRDLLDHRASALLRRRTAVGLLERRGASELFRSLLPAHPEPGTARIVGPCIYVYPEAGHAPPSSLPDGTFQGRHAAPALRRELGRSLGLADAGVEALLDAMVIVLPGPPPDGFLERERWRTEGFAALTDVGDPVSKHRWVTRTKGIRFAPPERADEATLRATFDALLRPRVGALLELLHSDLFALALAGSARGPALLDILDVGAHLDHVQRPLLDAIRRRARLDPRLSRASDLWCHQAQRWSAPASPSLQVWCQGLLRLDEGLRQLARRSPQRWPHWELAIFFAAHFLAETPPPPRLHPEDDMGMPGWALVRWFWPTWLRVLHLCG